MRKQFPILFIMFLFLLLQNSCNNPFPEFKEVEEGIYFKLLSFDEDQNQFQPNRYVVAEVSIFNNKKLIYRQFKEDVKAPKQRLAVLYQQLNEGDSAEFKIKSSIIGDIFPEIEKDKYDDKFFTAYVKVCQYLKAIDNPKDPEMQERILLNKYLKENNINKSKQGIYIEQIKKGNGNKIKNGKNISIHYKGKFVNELEFDNTFNDVPLTFTYGTPGQVIRGLEIALKGMRKGEKSKIIIPSQLAFGDEGSSTQVIPPYTTVIYELEIINVN